MGVFIHLNISKSVKKREWEDVYAETLQLVKAFPLAERRKVKCRGIDTICLVPTEEREDVYGWSNEKTRMGWFAEGDYERMHTAEMYCMIRDLVQDDDVEPDAGDAMLGTLPAYLNYDWKDPRFGHVYDIWGGKTQGEPYHMYLLAIACLIQSRLGEKAFVYGDITRGQCVKAVELANRVLEKPIDIPDRCDLDQFRRRVAKLSLSEAEQLTVFERLYLGTKGEEFGNYVRTMYSEKAQDDYWKAKFGDCAIGTRGFDEELKKYLAWGFDLGKLCGIVNYYDRENVPQYEKFVNKIMEAKLHLVDKNSEDFFDIDQEESAPYSIYTLMAQFVFAGARNPKVDRYIPIDEIKRILIVELGDKCNVESIINEYLKKEAEGQRVHLSKDTTGDELETMFQRDASETIQQMMNMKRQKIVEKREKYDVSDFEDLIYYEKGDKVYPALHEALMKSFDFYSRLTEEEGYRELLGQPAKQRCKWLADYNEFILIRDKDWNKIFTDIEEHDDAFARYYPMMRVEIESVNLLHLVTAIVLNDEVYAYCKENVAEQVDLGYNKGTESEKNRFIEE